MIVVIGGRGHKPIQSSVRIFGGEKLPCLTYIAATVKGTTGRNQKKGGCPTETEGSMNGKNIKRIRLQNVGVIKAGCRVHK